MRAITKAATAAVTAVLFLASPSSALAPMSANDSDGAVTISVKGKGLHVERIIVSSTHQRNGEAFRVYSHTGSWATDSYVTKWKMATFHSAGVKKFSMATWKINRNFPNGTWLCAISKKSSGNPCIKVHR